MPVVALLFLLKAQKISSAQQMISNAEKLDGINCY